MKNFFNKVVSTLKRIWINCAALIGSAIFFCLSINIYSAICLGFCFGIFLTTFVIVFVGSAALDKAVNKLDQKLSNQQQYFQNN